MKGYKGVYTVTEAAFLLPDTLMAPEVQKALCSPAEGLEHKHLPSAKLANAL